MNQVLTSIITSITLMLGEVESAASLNLFAMFRRSASKGGGERESKQESCDR